jgi:hypothetical protein
MPLQRLSYWGNGRELAQMAVTLRCGNYEEHFGLLGILIRDSDRGYGDSEARARERGWT